MHTNKTKTKHQETCKIVAQCPVGLTVAEKHLYSRTDQSDSGESDGGVGELSDVAFEVFLKEIIATP